MFLDKEVLFADNLAFGGTPATVELGSTAPVIAGKVYKGGPGKAITCFFVGSEDLAGCTGIKVLHTGDIDGVADVPLMSVDGDPAGKTIEFKLPSTTLRFVTIALDGTATAGSYSSGIVLEGVQTNL